MYKSLHMHARIPLRTLTHTRTHVRVYPCIRVYTYICIRAYVDKCKRAYLYTRILACILACMHACMHVRTLVSVPRA